MPAVKMCITGPVNPGSEVILLDRAKEGVLSLSISPEAGAKPRLAPLTAVNPLKVLRFRLLQASADSFILEATGLGEDPLSFPLYLGVDAGRAQLVSNKVFLSFSNSSVIKSGIEYPLTSSGFSVSIPWSVGREKRPLETSFCLLPLSWFSSSIIDGASCSLRSGIPLLLEELKRGGLVGYTDDSVCRSEGANQGPCPESHYCGDSLDGRWRAGCYGPCPNPNDECKYQEASQSYVCVTPLLPLNAGQQLDSVMSNHWALIRNSRWFWLGAIAVGIVLLVGLLFGYWWWRKEKAKVAAAAEGGEETQALPPSTSPAHPRGAFDSLAAPPEAQVTQAPAAPVSVAPVSSPGPITDSVTK